MRFPENESALCSKNLIPSKNTTDDNNAWDSKETTTAVAIVFNMVFFSHATVKLLFMRSG